MDTKKEKKKNLCGGFGNHLVKERKYYPRHWRECLSPVGLDQQWKRQIERPLTVDYCSRCGKRERRDKLLRLERIVITIQECKIDRKRQDGRNLNKACEKDSSGMSLLRDFGNRIPRKPEVCKWYIIWDNDHENALYTARCSRALRHNHFVVLFLKKSIVSFFLSNLLEIMYELPVRQR